MSDSEVADKTDQAGGDTEMKPQAEEEVENKEGEAAGDEEMTENMQESSHITVVNVEELDLDTGEMHEDELQHFDEGAEPSAVQNGSLAGEKRQSGDAIGSVAELHDVEDGTDEDKEGGEEGGDGEEKDGDGDEDAEKGENEESADEVEKEDGDEGGQLEEEGEPKEGGETGESEAEEVREGDESEPREEENKDEGEQEEGEATEEVEDQEGEEGEVGHKEGEGEESEQKDREEGEDGEPTEGEEGEEGEHKEREEGEEGKPTEGDTEVEKEGTPETTEESDLKEVDEVDEVDAEEMRVPNMPEMDENVGPPVEFTLRKMGGDEFTLDPEYDENVDLFDTSTPSSAGSDVTDDADVVSTQQPDEEKGRVVFRSASDREREAEQFQLQLAERASLRRRNMVLQKKLMVHFKRRKNKDVFRESTDEVTPEMEALYAKRLAQYGEVQAMEVEERAEAKLHIDQLEAEETQLCEELQDLVDTLVDREREISLTQVSRKTGRPLNEKLVERLLKRQREGVKTTGAQRLDYIRVREKVAAKEQAIKDLEDLGENLKIVDFEQLRIENQNLVEKIEEREEEMSRHRARAVHSIQALVHYREKSVGVLAEIDKLVAELDKKREKLDLARSEMNRTKALRDKLRAEYQREATAAGLLTKPQLLRDFEETQDECNALRAQLESLCAAVAEEQRALNIVRGLGHLAPNKLGPKMSYKESVDKRIEDQRSKRAAAKERRPPATQEEAQEVELFRLNFAWR